MRSFKVTKPGSKPTSKRTMSSSSERQAATASNTVVARLRTASTISAMTIVPEGSNDGEESTQKTQKKPRKTPKKAKDLARNGGEDWTPAQRAFVWHKRHTLSPEEGKTIEYKNIGEVIGKTAQACRLVMLQMRRRYKLGGWEHAIDPSFDYERYGKNEPQGEPETSVKEESDGETITAEQESDDETVTVEQESDDETITAEQESDDETVTVEQESDDEPTTPSSSLGSAAQFRTSSGDRVAIDPPSPLTGNTSDSLSREMQTRTESLRAQWGTMQNSYFREPGVADDSLKSMPVRIQTNAELNAASILVGMRNNES